MKIEQAILELRKYAKDLSSIGEVNDYIKSNKKEFLHKWVKVMQYYNYLLKNLDLSIEQINEISDIMDNIIEENPSLESWVYDIMKPKSEVKHSQKEEDKTGINIENIENNVNILVNRIKNMQSWDTDEVETIRWQLEKYQEIIIQNRSLFTQDIYDNLLGNINMALNKISKFNNMLDSDSMQGIMSM